MYTEKELEEIAILNIRNYLNRNFTDEEIKQKFDIAIKVYTQNVTQRLKRGMDNVSSIREGNQSITFKNAYGSLELDQNIKSLLPRPYIKLS